MIGSSNRNGIFACGGVTTLSSIPFRQCRGQGKAWTIRSGSQSCCIRMISTLLEQKRRWALEKKRCRGSQLLRPQGSIRHHLAASALQSDQMTPPLSVTLSVAAIFAADSLQQPRAMTLKNQALERSTSRTSCPQKKPPFLCDGNLL